jgi:alkylation response protein AidB-like acyl-CoA dehydrogenase
MDLRDTPDEAEFRAGVKAWLDENLPPGDPREWSRKMYEAGYAGLTWPAEYGGQGAPYNHQAIVLEEFARREAPQHMGVIGLGMAGPTIMAHGSEEQKRRYLPKILSADEIWCQGFSEPDAGSDLSAVRTRIDVREDAFVVSGQKVWSSFAHIADFCILVGRSDPESQRHAGLTYLIVDMRAPGVDVRPLRQITGEAEFNEIFLDGVVVPRENLLGEIGGGWQVAMTTLLHERGTLGFALSGVLEAQVGRLVALAKERGADDPIIRDRVATEWIELQALKLTNYRSLTTLMQTGIPGPEGSVSKLHWSEQNQRLTKLAMELLEGEDDGYWGHQQLRSRGNTIEAGTSEILRNIIAERVLGLPRSR